MHVVIVGNGVAGIEAALAVRAREPGWRITLVSEESDHFFSRTALMWVLCGQLSHRDIEPYERDLYERMSFSRVRARAVGVDVESQLLRLSGSHDPLSYDRLLLACGSRPRPAPWPGAELAGVGHFVTLQDLAWLERELHGGPAHDRPEREDAHVTRTAEDSPYRPRADLARERGRARRLVVVGGGLIGIEVVEAALAAGLRPDFVIREEWFWPMAIDRRESTWIAERMREHGVQVHLEHDVEALEGDERGRVAAVRTSAGHFECDLCVVCIGVVPNTGWLEGAGIERDAGGGILVDTGLRTSAPSVFAAGDCASVLQADGSRRPEPLWYSARAQGRVAARSLLGDDAVYERGLPYNSAKLMDVEYTTVGCVDARGGHDEWFFEETGRVRSTTRIVHEGGRVVGFNLLGRRWDNEVLARWIDEGRSLGYVLAHLGEAAFDTELVPKLKLPKELLAA